MTRPNSVVRFASADGKRLYAHGRAPILTSPVVAGTRGRLSAFSGSTTAQDVPGKSYALPDLSDFPTYNYTAPYQSGDDLQKVLTTRLSAASGGAGGHVILPNGWEGSSADFLQASNHYSLYGPLCHSLISPGGPTQARFKFKDNTSTQASQVPAQTDPVTGKATNGINPLSVFRIGPNNSTVQPPIHLYGITFEGGDQGHTYGGLALYWWGPGSTMKWCVLKGFGAGNWNSPPGETNQLNGLRGGGFLVEGVEIDGRLPSGLRQGGAVACNGPTSVTYRDVYIHDGLVSGCTFGTNGSVTTGTLTRNIETYDLKVENQANWSNDSGKQFAGINHEGVLGVKHIRPDIFIRNQSVVQKRHVAVNNAQQSSKVYIEDPVWHPEIGGSPPWARGCFSVQVDDFYPNASTPNKQLLSDITIVKDGVQLQPVHRNNAAAVGVDPSRHFVYET